MLQHISDRASHPLPHDPGHPADACLLPGYNAAEKNDAG
jgi:hypothetical protein